MASLEEIKNTRKLKLELIEKAGLNPYPSKVPHDISLKEARNSFEEISKFDKTISLAGRIVALRGQGAILFAVLDDGTDKFQAVIKKDDLSEKTWSLFNEAVDIGDIISVTGKLFTTKRGEKSISVNSWVMAAKSLLPLPEKWHGIEDPDEKLRKRYLDMIMNPGLRGIFERKSKFWETTRKFLKDRGFLEVETPTLEVTTGGAEARPFKTHHNDYEIPVYLRISVGELWQKRLMAAGFPKTFEIGRVYRNEGSSQEHLQEFSNMEFYWSYADYHDGMSLVKELYTTLAKEIYGKTKFSTRSHNFDLAEEWKEINFVDEINRQTGLNIKTDSDKKISQKLSDLKIKYEGENRERMIDTLWKYCRKNISGPAFIVHHPLIVAPLAKMRDDKETVQMFQPIIAGSEVGRGYSELNDPIDQRKRFEEQQKLIDSGDEEAMMADWEFVEMLEHGMPPTCGFGFGERLFAFFEDKPLREVQTFPLMRPKDSEIKKIKKTDKKIPAKKREVEGKKSKK